MQEKLYIISGPEFKSTEGHMLIINKAIYCLKIYGLH